MIGRLAASIHLIALLVIQAIDILLQFPSTVAEPGDNVTLSCSTSEDNGALFYWYKMKFGSMVQTVAVGTFGKLTLYGQFGNSRFTATKRGALYFLNIKNVSKEDEASYFCQSGSAFLMQVTNGTVLAVNDQKNQPKSADVNQSTDTESVPPCKGTEVDAKRDPVLVTVLGILLGLCVIVIAVLIVLKRLKIELDLSTTENKRNKDSASVSGNP